MLGLDGEVAVATSVTLGLGSVASVLSRLQRWWDLLPATRVKLKLGSPTVWTMTERCWQQWRSRSLCGRRITMERSSCGWMPTGVDP